MPKATFETLSSDMEAMQPYFRTVRDLLGGVETMRAGGERYLPRFEGEDALAYAYRRDNARYSNLFADVHATLAAKPFRREVAVRPGTASQRLIDLAEDVDARGNNLHVFAAEVFLNGLAYALDWIFVDYTRLTPRKDGRKLTLADERAQGARPYWVRIPADQMIAAETASIDGQEQFVHVRFRETAVTRDGFAEVCRKRVRILQRDKLKNGYGPARWELWEEQPTKSGTEWVLIDSGVLTIGIIPLVPFLAGRRHGSSWRVAPPLKGAADLAIEHYQLENNLKNITLLTAFPMLAAIGVQPEMAGGAISTVRVGPRTVLYAPPVGDGRSSDWRFLEPQGNSLRFLAEHIKATEEQLRELGRQPLTAQTGNLTVVSTAFAASKANSVLAAWALNLKDALEQALKFTALWLDDPSQPEVEIEDDFEADVKDDADLDALLKMRAEGDLSQDALWAEMKRRGVLSANFDPAQERERLLAEMPGEPTDEDLVGALPANAA